MSEPDALVARITITPENLERWFDSLIPPLETWEQDWQDWIDWMIRAGYTFYGWKDSSAICWRDFFDSSRYVEFRDNVRDHIDSCHIHRKYPVPDSIWVQTSYDEQTKIWRFLSIEVSENFGHMMALLAPFRAIEAFSESDKDDYVAFTNFFYSRGTEYSSAAVQFSDGKSFMLKDEKLPASIMQDITYQFYKAEKERIISAYNPDAWAD